MDLKIVVLNNSGNVGKSTLCRYFLLPRIEGAQIVNIESINSDGSNGEKYRATDFIEITKVLDRLPSAIVDVGSSNIEVFMNKLKSYDGAHEDIDYFIIPVTPQNKQQEDTNVTIMNLLDLDIPVNKIRVVFNQIDPERSFNKQFSIILENDYFKKLGIINYPRISETELFRYLAIKGKDISTVLNDERDFRALMKEATNPEDLEELSTDRAIKRLATGVNKELDVAFSNLDIK
ncbi:transcriptional regulator [Escherichia coli]|nr:transcriptional regulator [Escherichia coli]EEQ2361480.1 transcriptional regulator [Escherichia coli]EEQ4618788.1 transcriptional regulator [Escherichia coli]EEQ5344559.1 transcriptional regulator [Escherichia coli]EEQ7472348.1 transcriptional regulator [Escherichia coli]